MSTEGKSPARLSSLGEPREVKPIETLLFAWYDDADLKKIAEYPSKDGATLAHRDGLGWALVESESVVLAII